MTITPEKDKALRMRLKDKSWGYAIAHYIPIVWIYYAWTRRTLYPLIFIIVINWGIAGIINNIPGNDTIRDTQLQLISFIITPFLAKFGIYLGYDEAKNIVNRTEVENNYAQKQERSHKISDPWGEQDTSRGREIALSSSDDDTDYPPATEWTDEQAKHFNESVGGEKVVEEVYEWIEKNCSRLESETINSIIIYGSFDEAYEILQEYYAKYKDTTRNKDSNNNKAINNDHLDQLSKLKDMFDKGLIDQDEYSQLKKRALDL